MGACCLVKTEGIPIPIHEHKSLDHLNKALTSQDLDSRSKERSKRSYEKLSENDKKQEYVKFFLAKCKTSKTSRFNPDNQTDCEFDHRDSNERQTRTVGAEKKKKRIKIADKYNDFTSIKLSMNNTENSKVFETERSFSNCEYSLKIQLPPSNNELEPTRDNFLSSNQILKLSTSELSPDRSALKKFTGLSKKTNSNLSISDNFSEKKENQKVRFGFS